MLKPNDAVFSFLGIAQKAAKLVSGEYAVEQAVKNNKAFLVILSKDASINTKEKFHSICKSKGVPIYYLGDCKKLGKSIGKEHRKLIAIIDKGIAKALIERIKYLNGGGGY